MKTIDKGKIFCNVVSINNIKIGYIFDIKVASIRDSVINNIKILYNKRIAEIPAKTLSKTEFYKRLKCRSLII